MDFLIEIHHSVTRSMEGDGEKQIMFRVKRLNCYAKTPTRGYSVDRKLNIYASRKEVIEGNSSGVIHSDIRIIVPSEYYGRVVATQRIEHHIVGVGGTLSDRYNDEIFILVMNLGDEPFTIHEGEQIGHIAIMKVKKYCFCNFYFIVISLSLSLSLSLLPLLLQYTIVTGTPMICFDLIW